MPNPETLIERHLKKRAAKLGGIALKIVPAGRSGFPDRLVILPPGQLTFVEMKTPEGGLSPMQRVIHSRLKRLGVHVVVLNDRDAIDRWLNSVRLGLDNQSRTM